MNNHLRESEKSADQSSSEANGNLQMPMNQEYSLARDPVFFSMAAIFALLTTALPATIGQPRFLPVAQSITLTIFLAIALRDRQFAQALRLLTLWLVIQLSLMSFLTWLMPGFIEHAIPNGFNLRSEHFSWFFTGTPLPGGWVASPVGRAIETIGILVGSLASGGLVGMWFLMRAVNFTGYGIGTVLAAPDTSLIFLGAIPLWHLLRIAAYAAFVALLAEPLLTRNWSLHYYLTERRRVLIIAAALWLVALLLELLVAPFWYNWFGN